METDRPSYYIHGDKSEEIIDTWSWMPNILCNQQLEFSYFCNEHCFKQEILIASCLLIFEILMT